MNPKLIIESFYYKFGNTDGVLRWPVGGVLFLDGGTDGDVALG